MRRLVCICLIAIAAFAGLLPTTGGAEAKRVALVVGIDKYDHLESHQQLRKAVNDSRAIAGAFKAMGYEVAKVENVGRLDFLRNWSIFLNGIEPGDEVAFFFAGHGIEIARQNFLLPGDAPVVKPGEEQVMRASAIAMGELLDQLRERQPRVSLTIIDACRDNPFTDGRGRSIGATRGLARIDPPRGSFVMLSAAAGETSLDRLGDGDKNPNSIYTRSLLPRLKEQGATIVEIARLVRQDVVEIARKHAHVQTPAYFDELVGDFCPAGCETAAAEPSQLAPQPAAAPAAVPVPAPQPAPVAPPPPPPAQEEPEVAAVDPTPSLSPPAPAPAGPARILETEDDAPYYSVAFSPDGRLLAAGTHGKRVVVFDLATSQVLHRLEGHTELVIDVAFSPDSRLIASASWDKTVKLWDAGTGKLVHTLVGHGHWAIRVAFSPDGALLASGSADTMLRLWDVKSGKLRHTIAGHDNSIYGVIFDPEGVLVSADAVDNVQVHDAATGMFMKKFETGEHTLSSVALSPEGKLLATGHSTKKLKLWDSQFNLVGERTDFPADVNALAFSPTQPLIASLCDSRIQLWTPELDRPRAEWSELWVNDVAFSPDGNTIAAAGVKVWLYSVADKIAGFSPKAVVEPEQNHQKLAAVDPAPALAPSAPAPAGPSRILEEEGLFYTVAFSPDGKRLAAGMHEKRVVVFDLATSAVVHRLEGHKELIRDVAFSPDSRLIASASNDKTVKLWDALSGKLVRTLTGDGDWVMNVAFSADGALLASGGADKMVRLWDVKSGKLRHTLKGHDNLVKGVMFDPEGVLISVDAVDNVRVHDSATGKFIKAFDTAEHTLETAALSPDGRLLATGHFTKKLKLWDAEFNLVRERTDFPAEVEALAFSPTQPLIASVCSNRIQLWTPELDRPRAEWAEYLVNDVAFSPDGNTIAAVGGEVWLYRVADKIAGR